MTLRRASRPAARTILTAWTWPWLGISFWLVKGTMLAPVSCSWRVTSGPVTWLGTGCRIVKLAVVVGRPGVPELALPLQPAARTAARRTAAIRRRGIVRISERPYRRPRGLLRAGLVHLDRSS